MSVNALAGLFWGKEYFLTSDLLLFLVSHILLDKTRDIFGSEFKQFHDHLPSKHTLSDIISIWPSSTTFGLSWSSNSITHVSGPHTWLCNMMATCRMNLGDTNRITAWDNLSEKNLSGIEFLNWNLSHFRI